jgi:hypothetical protein
MRRLRSFQLMRPLDEPRRIFRSHLEMGNDRGFDCVFDFAFLGGLGVLAVFTS